MNSVGTIAFSFNHEKDQPTKEETLIGLERAIRQMHSHPGEWEERIEIDDTVQEDFEYEQEER